MTEPVKLLVVDDSKVMREAIVEMFATDSAIEVVGQAVNGAEALQAARQLNPDVITLDVAMPVMDGMTALKHLMIKDPHPIVMLSSLTLEGAKVAFDALRYGAVDFISKPSALNDTSLSQQEAEIRSKIEYAASVEVNAIKYIRSGKDAVHYDGVTGGQCKNIVAIGAAEGGYGALLKIIPQLPVDMTTAYLSVLYVAPEYIDAFASYLNNYSAVEVKRAVHDEEIKPGVCYLSSGVDYMSVHKQKDAYSLHVSPAPFASRKGAADMLLFSTADTAGTDSIGIVLSGLGRDGAEGLEEITRMGGTAIVQDPKTCLCKEMANAALELNSPEYVVADSNIATTLGQILSGVGGGQAKVAGGGL
jgi:two-component system chemotaxis response regulator CheB